MKHILRWLVLILVVVMLSVPSAVRADVAPPSHPPGANVGPDSESTQVRMVAETVVIDVLAGAPGNSLGKAKVTADFTMRNLGSAVESMGVRFPISSNNGSNEFPEITDLNIRVDGSTVSTHRIMQEDPIWGNDSVPWAEFNVSFPLNQDVHIQVTYSLEGTGYDYEPHVVFYYVFHTGAGWSGTIGSADLVVRLPYEANPLNVIFDDQVGWSFTPPGGVINGREIKWHFDNLEPDRNNDFALRLVKPSAWQNVLTEQANVQSKPNDGEAWGRLGKLYKEMTFEKHGFRNDKGGSQIYRLSVQAYENAVRLKPDDALWHAGFADLLAVHSYFESFGSNAASPDTLRAMQEINRALELAPHDPKVKEIAENIYFLFMDAIQQTENGYIFLWLTATPIPASPTLTSAEPTSTPPATTPPLATATAVPAIEAVPTFTPPTAKISICGSVLFIPLALIVYAGKRRKHSGL